MKQKPKEGLRTGDDDWDAITRESIHTFAERVVQTDEEAIDVLRSDGYDIDRFASVMEELAASAIEANDFSEFDRLSGFVNLSRQIFPNQFCDLVEALADSHHPIVRGTAAFSLGYVLEEKPIQALGIWHRMLADQHPKVLQAAVMMYDESAQRRPESAIDSLNWRQRRALRRDTDTARKKVEGTLGA